MSMDGAIKNGNGPYDDIIGLPHHQSVKHARMPLLKRAAQFAPFDALSGYGDVIRETARETVEKAQPEEDARQELERRLRFLMNTGEETPEADFRYFAADGKKSGGAYRVKRGRVRKVDSNSKELVLSDGTRIPLDDLYSIECETFPETHEDY